MKVTALIPDELIHDVRVKTRGKNITDALVIALKEWLALKKIISLNKRISQNPLHFQSGFSAPKVRSLSRA